MDTRIKTTASGDAPLRDNDGTEAGLYVEEMKFVFDHVDADEPGTGDDLSAIIADGTSNTMMIADPAQTAGSLYAGHWAGVGAAGLLGEEPIAPPYEFVDDPLGGF